MDVAHQLYTFSAANGLAIAGLLGLLIAVCAIFYEKKRRRTVENALAAMQSQLEGLVAERTVELESLNRSMALQIREGEMAVVQLTRQIDLLASILNTIDLAAVVCHGDGNLILANRAASELIGLSDEAIGTKTWIEKLNLYSLQSKSRLSRQQSPLVRALNGEQVRNAEFLLIPRSGAQRHLLVNAQLLDLGQHRCGAILTLCDLTEKVTIQDKSARAQRLENIGALAGGLAHDLNNVLAPIVMGVELLKLKATNGSTEILSTIQSSAQRATDLVKQILTFGRGLDGKRVLLGPGQILQEMKRIVQGT